jgi:hypothetical protein
MSNYRNVADLILRPIAIGVDRPVTGHRNVGLTAVADALVDLATSEFLSVVVEAGVEGLRGAGSIFHLLIIFDSKPPSHVV